MIVYFASVLALLFVIKTLYPKPPPDETGLSYTNPMSFSLSLLCILTQSPAQNCQPHASVFSYRQIMYLTFPPSPKASMSLNKE